MKFQLLMKSKMLKTKTFLAFKLPDFVFIMLINVKMPTNIYEHDKFCQLVLKILSEKEILTSVKGHNPVKNLRKMTSNNPKVDLVNINAHAKFGQILSIDSQDIELK